MTLNHRPAAVGRLTYDKLARNDVDAKPRLTADGRQLHGMLPGRGCPAGWLAAVSGSQVRIVAGPRLAHW